ncbi:uncharacterized protein YecT (DUF1311 family) [Granulicella aggregans]|uniref:Uncharacterized protein YecT (DUF1311 family) n=1 Tax=Granulicella aggregans TaxID=474949 RepID=A0A7W8E6G8_9BACT|nr:hypothetical protein [Granulicella aggregans]MBB5060662.1 uncharacterized protein YecT (DUF1311 family) [Granulicella aggregans]
MQVLRALAIQLFALNLSAVAPIQQATTSSAIQPTEPPSLGSNYDPGIFQAPLLPADLTYLQQFAGAPAKDLLRDKQFKKLMKLFVPGCIFHYGRDMSLPDALSMAFDGSRIPVELRDNRYLLVVGQQGPYLQGRGFLWIDLQTGIALGGFYFAPTNGEPTPALNLFSKQIKEDTLGLSQLPPAFVDDFIQWSTSARVGPVVTGYFITGNNKKILVEHDEDFCVSADGTVAPRNGVCEQLNAQAADLDVTAADYLDQVHHATNATAWMLSPSQVAWLAVRERTCGGVLDPLPCRINITRQRIHVLTGRPPIRPHPVHR